MDWHTFDPGIQEGKAEAALDAIRAMLLPHTTVVRAGARREIDATEVVPGDIVVLASPSQACSSLAPRNSRSGRSGGAAFTRDWCRRELAFIGADAAVRR